jgi:hypothetical protein
MTQIYLLIGLMVVLGVFGWFRSAHTRKLVKFALIFIAGAAALFGLLVLARVLWFPYKPL